MPRHRPVFVLMLLTGLLLLMALAAPTAWATAAKTPADQGFRGAQSCRECHEKFYRLWATSHHGKAMQAYSDQLAKEELTPQGSEITIGGNTYKAHIAPGEGYVLERSPRGEKKLPMLHALGGKNVYYFLTPLDRGRLQTLPVAYDRRQKQWFDTARSGVRHFAGRPDQPLPWTDRAYTFNTSCHGCHVSQFASNYDPQTDTYHTTWAEPGINCETCHGPAQAHIRVCQDAPKGTVPKDLAILRGGRSFTHDQNNATCSSCHAKMVPLTASFKPGERFWDHYDLVLLDHPDYYPDGRDLGENYTYTTWLMSPCVKSGKLDCTHCHTSSGRFRQQKDPNAACLPCHEQRVKNAPAHTRHQPGGKGSQCISCHMPMTSFARMNRSDHSMLPPTPAVTLKYKSPNACNLCHKDKTAAWADEQVRKWHQRDYQAGILDRAGLIAAARQRNWSLLGDMLAYLKDPKSDEVFSASLIRLLRDCPDPGKWTGILTAMQNPSPLVRASAAEALIQNLDSTDALVALFKALKDDSRLVRVRAVASLARIPPRDIQKEPLADLRRAEGEFIAAMAARPDDPASRYNLGNYYLDRRQYQQAVTTYEKALKLQPEFFPALLNAAMAYGLAGDNAKNMAYLRRAQKLRPDDVAVNLNLGLLLGQQKRFAEAKIALRAALKADPRNAVAAYNLGVLMAAKDPGQAIQLISQAARLRPDHPQYSYAVAYYLKQNGREAEAVEELQRFIQKWPEQAIGYLSLGEILEKQGKAKQAAALYRRALKIPDLSRRERLILMSRLREAEATPNKK